MCVRRLAAKIERHCQRRRDGQFVAVAGLDGQVERLAAASFGITAFVEVVIVDGDDRAQRQPASGEFIGGAARGRDELAVPFAAGFTAHRGVADGAVEVAHALEIDLRAGHASVGRKSTPIAVPMAGQFILAGVDLVVGATVVVVAIEQRARQAEAADTRREFTAAGEAKTGDIEPGGAAGRFRPSPAHLLQPHAAAIGACVGRGRISQHPGRCPRRLGDGFERAAGVVGQHLAQLRPKAFGIADIEERARNLGVAVERLDDRLIGTALRGVEAKLRRRLARQRQHHFPRTASGDAALEQPGQLRCRTAEVGKAAQRAGLDDNIVAGSVAHAGQGDGNLGASGEARGPGNVEHGVGLCRTIDGDADDPLAADGQ